MGDPAVAKLVTAVQKFLTKEEEGATAVEYGIMVAAVIGVIVVTVIGLGTQIEAAFQYILTQMQMLTT